MKKITEVFASKNPTLSFEFYPPKTPSGRIKLYEKAARLSALGADFFSVTYGAGGGTRVFTEEVASELQKRFSVPVMQHLAAYGHSAAEIKDILDKMKSNGVRSVMALRGDRPDNAASDAPEGDFRHASDLCGFIRKNYGDYFSLGVAGYPDGHPECPSPEAAASHLKAKLAAGGDFVVTQFFFDNKKYFEYARMLSAEGIDGVRVIPGIIPVTDWGRLVSFCAKCKVPVPSAVAERFAPIAADAAATADEGVRFARAQCEELLGAGAPGVHIYTLNQSEAAELTVKDLIK